jgi:hypothetical protein
MLADAEVPLSSSHRHSSHLMMIFPLRTLDLAQPAAAALARTSIDHWLGMPGALTGWVTPLVACYTLHIRESRSLLAGFCRTFASPMSVMLGRRCVRERASFTIRFVPSGSLQVGCIHQHHVPDGRVHPPQHFLSRGQSPSLVMADPRERMVRAERRPRRRRRRYRTGC